MNDQWIKSDGTPIESDWDSGLPLSDDWILECGCDGPNTKTSIVDSITMTGSPATITSVAGGKSLWSIVLNDGTPQADFAIDRFDDTGLLIDSPMTIVRATGVVTFHDPVMLARDPVEPMEAVTLEYFEAHGAGVPEVPDNQTYGRTEGAWNLVVPAAGGTFTGVTNLGAGGAVTSGALLFAGSAVCSIPDVSQLTIGGGSLGQVPATDGNGNLSWVTPVTGGPYLPISGGTVTGNLTVNQVLTVQGSNSFVLNAPVTGGNQRAILSQASSITRWQLILGDQAAEGTGNAGTNFTLAAYSATGSFLGNWLTIARADGATVFNGSGVTIQGGLAVNGLLAVNSIGNFYLPGGSNGQVLTTNGSGLLSWTNQSGGIADAPNDGTLYGRKSLGWAHLTHSDITDWATAVPPAYVLPTASTTVLGGVRVDGTTITIAGGVISGSAVSGPPVTISDTAPSSPAVGALWWDSVGGQLYVRYQDPNTTQWVPTTNAASLPPPASTTVLGSVKVDGTSIKAAADGTISTVLVPMGDNRIINGDMRIDQRNAGASGTANGYTADRWYYVASQTSKLTWQRGTGVAPGFPYQLGFNTSSAYTPLAADYFVITQPIEADMVSDFAFGTPQAQPVTLSFWVYSSLTGQFGGSLRNGATNNRGCPFAYSIPAANTWTKITVTIPGDTGGTWTLSGNSSGLVLTFDLGSGANVRGPAGVWASSPFLGANGSINPVATNGAGFVVTGVKLEIGSVATPFNRQSLAKSMADCQRYYQTISNAMCSGYQIATGALYETLPFATAMRATPTVAVTGVSYANASGYGVNNVYSDNVTMACTVTAQGNGYAQGTVTLSAEL